MIDESLQQQALDKFLAQQPDLQDEIKALSPAEQRQQVQWALEDDAQAQGLEPWERVLELVAQSPQDLKTLRLGVHRQVAEALGMNFDDYCELNEIEA